MQQLKSTIRTLVCIFMLSSIIISNVPAVSFASDQTATSQIQVFDIKQEKIVLQVENNKRFQKYANKIIKKMDTLAPQLQISTDCTHIIKLPLLEPREIKLKDQVIVAHELFIFNCENEEPLVLVFSEQRKPFLFQCDTNAKKLMKMIEKAA
ncbi:hypothetical protein ACFSTH_04080 [Paenibacillus yanchengensis]|uniref:Uncharacterized protein n=1 Tax=Paenibacillus yanchengensis TaxID=2035833 RepID=A0ABW4YJQ0_9BACL